MGKPKNHNGGFYSENKNKKRWTTALWNKYFYYGNFFHKFLGMLQAIFYAFVMSLSSNQYFEQVKTLLPVSTHSDRLMPSLAFPACYGSGAPEPNFSFLVTFSGSSAQSTFFESNVSTRPYINWKQIITGYKENIWLVLFCGCELQDFHDLANETICIVTSEDTPIESQKSFSTIYHNGTFFVYYKVILYTFEKEMSCWSK